MANPLEKDKKRRKNYLRYLKKRSSLKDILKNKNITPIERYNAQIQITKLNINSSLVRIKKRCIITGRASGIVGPFNISRFNKINKIFNSAHM